MDDRMRVSDADREQVTARLREHFAEGRLTQEELDERVTAALSAKTFGDLRRVMHDLPEPEPAGAGPGYTGPQWAGPGRGPGFYYRRGPRLFPLALFLLFLFLVMGPAGWVFFGFLKIILLFWLVLTIAGLFGAMRFKRHVRRSWRETGYADWWRNQNWPHS